MKSLLARPARLARPTHRAPPVNLNISQKGLVLVAVPLVFQIGFVLLVVRFQGDQVAAERLAAHTREVISQAHEVRTLVSDAAAGSRGYVVARDPAFAAPLRAAARELPGRLDDLDAQVVDNPGQAARARAVRAAAEAELAWLGEIDRLVGAGAVDAAAGRVRAGRGEGLLGGFRREVGAFLAEEERLDRERAAALDRSRGRLNALLGAGGVVAVCCSLAVAFAFLRGIVRRFALVEANARRLAAAEPLPPPLGGTDEAARLDRALRDMAAELARAGDSLRAKEEQLRLLVGSVQDYAILMLDPDGRVASWNRGAERIKGYTADEVLGRHFSLFYPPEDVARGWPARELELAAATGRFEDEGWRVRKDGTRYWANVVLAPVRDAAGALVGFSKVSRDLTDRKRAEDEVRDLYDNAPCGYHSVGPDGTVVAANRTELRWLGYDAGEVVGKARFADFVSPASRDAYQRGFARVKESGSVAEVELELVRKDGTTFPVLVSSSSVRDAGGRYLRSRTTLSDITDRKRAEDEVRRLNADLEDRVRARTAELAEANAALRREEGLFRGAFENTNVAMVLTDLDNRFLRANAAFDGLFGYTPEEVLGLGLADITHPDHMAESLGRREALLGGAGDCFQMEKRYRHRDGRVIWGMTNVALVRGPDGGPRMYVGQVQDITERKAAEAAVRERAAELEAANRELAHKNAENEMFVYSVSHDLRSPLVNLQGFSRELEKACRGLAELFAGDAVAPEVRAKGSAILDGKVAKSVGFIQTAVTRLSGIIDALLRLSRAGRVEYRWEAVDVAEVVGRVVKAAHLTIAEKGAAVRVGELPAAWGDRTAVEQVFANLIGNALTYLDPARPGVIEVGAAAGDAAGFRTYFVRDNGLGIADGHRQKIFQAFQRAHPGVGSGEGLGLAIVARVAERHRGRVWVESRPGEGSTFYVALPEPPAAGRR